MASIICFLAVQAKYKYGYDDSLDAFGVHGVGGLTGALLTGLFAQKSLNDAGSDGLFFGNAHQLWIQVLACAVSGVYASLVTFVLLKVIDKTIGLRVVESDEREGLDSTQHGEDAYAG